MRPPGAALLAGAGTWLILYDFPRLTILPGLALLGLAVALRPRFGGVDDEAHFLDREQAPELWALVGHELGHFVNGDQRRGPLAQVALTTLGRLAALTRPGQPGLNGFVDLLVGIVRWLLSRLLMGVHLLVVWIGQRDAQRAEYLADEIGARAAGSAAAVRLLDVLLMGDALDTVIRREARARRSGAAWRAAADVARANLAAAVPSLRQLSRRDEVSLFASHPPTGLRSVMLERRPQHAAGVILTEQQAERIDHEIAGPVERIRRDLASAG